MTNIFHCRYVKEQTMLAITNHYFEMYDRINVQ